MNKFVIYLINIYRKHISPYKMPSCRFTPTCSQYAAEAFERFGFFKALFLSAYRILRCNPFCKGGYDPLPQKKTKG